MISIKQLCFAGAVLIATSGVAYGQCIAACGGRTPPPPPPRESHNNLLGDELKFGPIGGAKSKPQVQVLGGCRIKYSKAITINAEWTKHFGRTGWWCVYKPKLT
jgi:hypothetical protein